ncbi:hypothetical protein F2P47_06520 [Parvibaculum sedimenti]|uniref:Uncharacterized protein n=1 Tax=Parvibaculum sedimenti TaxID=2608632 RepID=A0A6N6VJI7_9HYPH|nr:hypothetical protein [Parvibaculum sedimenti]KAB7740700.1 hypothetical protein F2P47_06520 [Parvibaculum sedimenti]
MLDLLDDGNVDDDRLEAVRVADMERDEVTRRSVARFARAMWIVVALLLLFNSGQLITVVNGFGVGPVQDAAVALSTTWNEQMEKNGLAKPVAVIRAFVERLRGAGWSEVHDGAVELRGTYGEAKG